VKFSVPVRPPTMISGEERRYLYWLGRSAWTGAGDVVEIGPWLGGSTVCLAAGMRDSGHDTTRRLQVFDNFVWRGFMSARAPLPLGPGESFQPFFLENVAAFGDMIESHARALPDEEIDTDREASSKRFSAEESVPPLDRFTRGPIEIVFIDGAKSWRGMRHLLEILREHLIPGTSLLVCQDYKYWGTYWVPILMTRLAHHVTPVHNVHDGTTLTFRLTSAIPRELVDGIESHVRDVATDGALAEVERAAMVPGSDGDRHGARCVQLSQVSFLSHQGRVDEAALAFREAQRRWPLHSSTVQLELARSYLESEKSVRIPRTAGLAAARLPRWLWDSAVNMRKRMQERS